MTNEADQPTPEPASPAPTSPTEGEPSEGDVSAIAWEYRLFAEVLQQGRDDLEATWRDHQLSLPRGPYRRLDPADVPRRLSAAFGELSWIVEPVERVFDSHIEAFGKPGQAGDADLIRHFASWILLTYRRLLDWAAELRNEDPGADFMRAVRLSAHAVDAPLDQFRAFIDDSIYKIRQAERMIAGSTKSDDRRPIELSLTLTLEVDQALLDEAHAELARATADTLVPSNGSGTT